MYHQMEGDQPKLSDGMDAEVRSGFVRKVYGILTVQLLVTAALAAPFQQMDRTWLAHHIKLYQIAVFGTAALMFGVLCCCKNTMRTFPQNYIVLGMITVGMGIEVGFVSAMYKTQSVLLVFMVTAGIFLSLTAFAFTTKYDFTGFGPYLFVALAGLCIMSFIMMFLPYSSMMMKVYSCVGAILFSFYIVYDTQQIAGGKHKKHQLGVDEYAFGALTIYLDIINLFMLLLELLGDRK